MRAWTSYYGGVRHLPPTILPLAISRVVPGSGQLHRLDCLAPPLALVHALKKGQIDWAGYVQCYEQDVLGRADPAAVLARMEALGQGGDVALLCYEKDHTQCHRSLVARWLSPVIEAPVLEWSPMAALLL